MKRDINKINKLIDNMRGSLAKNMDVVLLAIEDLQSKLEERYYNRSEKWQQSQKGDLLLLQIEKIKEFWDEIEDIHIKSDEQFDELQAKLEREP